MSDIAYGSKEYLKELSAELKEQGVIAEDSTIEHAADLLNAINETSTKGRRRFGGSTLQRRRIDEND